MIKLTRAVAALLAFVLAAAAQYPAQDWRNVKAVTTGVEVRVKVNSRTVRGQIQSVTDDAIAVNSRKGQEMLARQEVVRVSVKVQGHRGRNTLIGLGAGAAVGLVAGVAGHTDCTGFCLFNTTRGQDGALGAIVFGLIGTLVGAVIPTGGWHEVYKQ